MIYLIIFWLLKVKNSDDLPVAIKIRNGHDSEISGNVIQGMRFIEADDSNNLKVIGNSVMIPDPHMVSIWTRLLIDLVVTIVVGALYYGIQLILFNVLGLKLPGLNVD